MKKLALLAIPMCLVFLLFIAIEDGFSRGGGGRGGGGGMRGGGFGGGYGGGGGAVYRGGGAASRSPSMSSHSRSRSSVSQSRPAQSRDVASRPQRPSSPGKVASQRPTTSGQKLSSAAGSRAQTGVPAAGQWKPSQAQLQQHLNLPQQGGRGMSDLGKIGAGAAAGALGYAGAQQLLGGDRAGLGDRGGVGERPGAGDRLQAGTLPAERPGAGGRPGIGDRPGVGDRPGIGDRPGAGDRPGIGERPGIGDRPSQLPSRPNAGQIRDNIGDRYDNLFTPQWWRHHPGMANAYWQNFGRYQYARNHWWRPAAWGALGGWVAGSAWESPAYYDYGEGIYYEGEQVYMNGQPVASAGEYYQQASDLATSAPPAQASETEWMPLGVFAISRDQATSSNALLQLAVDKNGVIAGTYYNTATDVGRPVRGKVDKKTQRAAWTFSDGKNTDIIMETGIFNLTQAQTEALVHFGREKSQQWLMVRLDEPKETETAKEGNK
jgi:hypothetical protein